MYDRLAKRIETGETAAVGIRELHLFTSGVIKRISDGKRLVVTNHGSPRAVVFSMRDAVELALDSYLESVADRAASELRAGSVVEPWSGSTGPFRVLLASQAVSDFEALPSSAIQAAVKTAVLREARRPSTSGPLWLERTLHGRWLVPFSRPDERSELIHAVIDACEVEDELIGMRMAADRKRRNGVRGVHCRDLVPRRLSASPIRTQKTRCEP